jgi:cytochrome d ubiquinol oxidase subunit I
VTEVGRQPWIIYRVMRTSEALTPMPGLIVPLVVLTGLYVVLTAAITWLMYHQVVLGPHYVAKDAEPGTGTGAKGGDRA